MQALETYLGRPVTHVACAEVGGVNSTIPIAAAAQLLGLPLLDADGMGRAFPELQMVLPTLYGVTATPLAFSDEKGNIGVLHDRRQQLDRTHRPGRRVEMGCSVMISGFPMSGAQAREALVAGSLSRCAEIGRGDHCGPRRSTPTRSSAIVRRRSAAASSSPARSSTSQRGTTTGFARGARADRGSRMRRSTLSFQNEHLMAHVDGAILADDARPDHGARRTTPASRSRRRRCATASGCEWSARTERRALALAGGPRDGRPGVLRLRPATVPLRRIVRRRSRELATDGRGPARPGPRRHAARHRRRRRSRTSARCWSRARSARARSRSSTPMTSPTTLFVIPTAQMGAPTVMIEKIPAGTEPTLALRDPRTASGQNGRCHDADRVRRHQLDDPAGRCRGDRPAGRRRRRHGPRIPRAADGDVLCVRGARLVRWRSRVERGEQGRSSTPATTTGRWSGSPAASRSGSAASVTSPSTPMSGADVKRTAVPRTISMALALGRAIRVAREGHRSPVRRDRRHARPDAVLAPARAVRRQGHRRRATHHRRGSRRAAR